MLWRREPKLLVGPPVPRPGSVLNPPPGRETSRQEQVITAQSSLGNRQDRQTLQAHWDAWKPGPPGGKRVTEEPWSRAPPSAFALRKCTPAFPEPELPSLVVTNPCPQTLWQIFHWGSELSLESLVSGTALWLRMPHGVPKIPRVVLKGCPSSLAAPVCTLASAVLQLQTCPPSARRVPPLATFIS